MSIRKDVRLQTYITSDMDDKLEDMASLMGITKHELIRFSIANTIGGWNMGVQMATEKLNKEK